MDADYFLAGKFSFILNCRWRTKWIVGVTINVGSFPVLLQVQGSTSTSNDEVLVLGFLVPKFGLHGVVPKTTDCDVQTDQFVGICDVTLREKPDLESDLISVENICFK